MTFDSSKSHVDYGDIVIIFFSHYSTMSVTVKKGEITQTKYGAMKHDSLVGHRLGSKFKCTKVSCRTCCYGAQLTTLCFNSPQGWVYILRPTAELWTVSLHHRTQILYAADIAMVIFQLELKPGSVVCESGKL